MTTAAVTRFPEEGFRDLPHLRENDCAHLRGGHVAAGGLDRRHCRVGAGEDLVRGGGRLELDLGMIELLPHQTLDRMHRVGRVGHRLALRGLPDEAFVTRRHPHDRGRGTRALCIRDNADLELAVRRRLGDGNTGVRCTEVDADDLPHPSPAASRRAVEKRGFATDPNRTKRAGWGGDPKNDALSGREHAYLPVMIILAGSEKTFSTPR